MQLRYLRIATFATCCPFTWWVKGALFVLMNIEFHAKYGCTCGSQWVTGWCGESALFKGGTSSISGWLVFFRHKKKLHNSDCWWFWWFSMQVQIWLNLLKAGNFCSLVFLRKQMNQPKYRVEVVMSALPISVRIRQRLSTNMIPNFMVWITNNDFCSDFGVVIHVNQAFVESDWWKVQGIGEFETWVEIL